ncbi:MAG TPA: hypothetical protein PKC73_00145 [Dermatophilaceae bacterium]|jgi:hypothetical protein|nr:hypothetical protein [Dermatophilaceae bacterium]
MNAVKPEIHLSVFGRKKKVAPAEETSSTEELIDNAIVAAKNVATNTVEIAEVAVERIAVKVFIGAIVGGAILIAVNTAGKILTNALDNRTTN